MIINRKISAILYTILFQCSFLNAITEKQAYFYTALIATGGAFFASKASENSYFILSTFALAGTFGYTLLKEYTPTFRMNEAQAIFDNTLSKNKLAKGYREMVENIRQNPTNSTHTDKEREYEIGIISQIHLSYPVVIDQQPFPLITATNELTIAKKQLALVTALLDTTILDIPEEERTKDNALWSRYTVLSERLQNYTNNVKVAQVEIPMLSPYNEQLNGFIAWQNNQKKLAIDQQNADAAMIAATAAQEQAQALQKQANATKSVARLAWIKSWLWYLLGIKPH